MSRKTELKTYASEDTVFKDAVSNTAQLNGYSVMYPRHILETLMVSQNPEFVSILPGGITKAQEIAQYLDNERAGGVEPWRGSVVPIGRVTSIFENAQERAGRNGTQVPTHTDYFVALLTEEMYGATDISDVLYSYGMQPDHLLRSIVLQEDR